ncbi:MAG TPA: hypothetical protein VKR06_44095, partial [Ktedonosporobacter sp.]|nr:hypothetical protein [Ktedonosporobacter sp.]
RRLFNQGINDTFHNSVLISIISAVLIGGISILSWGLSYELSYGLHYGLSWGPGYELSYELSYGLHSGLSLGLSHAWLFAVSGGLLVGTTLCGGLSVLRHYILRFILWHIHVFPWKAHLFLEDARDRILLRSTDGGYSFTHRLLLDYFADYTPSISDAYIPPRSRRKWKSRTASYSSILMRTNKRSFAHQKRVPLVQQGGAELFQPTIRARNLASADVSARVGIWHSPIDEKVAARLRTHLQAVIRAEEIVLWDASRIQPGALWQKERAQAIASVDVAVILVSADFLACDNMSCKELPQLLHRASTQHMLILCLHVSPCDFEGHGLENFQPLNSPDKPLAKLKRADREQVLTQAARIIRQQLAPICKQETHDI